MSTTPLAHYLRRTALVVGIWSIPVFIAAVGAIIVRSRGVPLTYLIGTSAAVWYVWVLATPFIDFVYQRRPHNRDGMPAWILANAVIVFAIYTAQCYFALAVGHATGLTPATVTPVDQALRMISSLLPFDVFLYVGVQYARFYRDRDLKVSQLATQLERAKLIALRSQLQPHFLFNALNSIAMLVRRDRKRDAIDVIVGFSELLRYVLDESGSIDVTLDEELQFVRRYLDIERVRHQDHLRVEYAVDPETLKALVPNLVLQPLVENALKHGISRLPEGGLVRIASSRRGAILRIEVENDGPPLTASEHVDGSTGLGLRNLRDRLDAIVGAESRLLLGPATRATGALAVIEIPLRKRERSAAQAPALERVG